MRADEVHEITYSLDHDCPSCKRTPKLRKSLDDTCTTGDCIEEGHFYRVEYLDCPECRDHLGLAGAIVVGLTRKAQVLRIVRQYDADMGALGVFQRSQKPNAAEADDTPGVIEW